MKRTKRKYTRHEKVVETKLDALEPITEAVKEESNSKIPTEFSFNDLPLSLRAQVEFIIEYRKRLNLPDDSKDRKALAIRMFRGDRPR